MSATTKNIYGEVIWEGARGTRLFADAIVRTEGRTLVIPHGAVRETERDPQRNCMRICVNAEWASRELIGVNHARPT